MMLTLRYTPRWYAPGNQVSLDPSIEFTGQGFHPPKASVMSREISPPQPGSSGHLATANTPIRHRTTWRLEGHRLEGFHTSTGK